MKLFEELKFEDVQGGKRLKNGKKHITSFKVYYTFYDKTLMSNVQDCNLFNLDGDDGEIKPYPEWHLN